MSLATTVTRGVRSATYNPEAERAVEQEKKEANEIKRNIRTALAQAQDNLSKLSSNANVPKSSVKELQTLIDDMKKYLTDYPEASPSDYADKYIQFTESLKAAVAKSDLLTRINALIILYKASIENAHSKKQLSAEKKKELEDKLKEIQTIVDGAGSRSQSDLQSTFEGWNREYVELLKTAGVSVSAAKDPKAIEQQAKETEEEIAKRKENERKQFSFSRFAKRVSATASTIVSSFLYIMICLVMGMLAANDAVGREPYYRILYFIYGCIFAPFLLFYYLYRWYNGTAPKIYTLLPYTQTNAETSIGRFFLFPFYYQEDKVARDLMVDFLTKSAEAVGKTFDPATLGTVGNHAEKALENMKKLTSESSLPNMTQLALNTAAMASTATGTPLPNLTKLKVNT